MNPRSISRRRHVGLFALSIVGPVLLLASVAQAAPPKPDGDPDQTTQSEISRIAPLELRIREAIAHVNAFVAARLGGDFTATRRR